MSHTKRCSQRPTLREEQAYLFLCLCLLGVAISLQSIGYLSVLAGSMIGWLLYRSEAKRWGIVRRLLILSGFIILSILPIAIGSKSTDRLWLDLGGWGITREGSILALRTGLRCLASASSMMLLLYLLPLHRLYSVLRSLGVPQLFIELIELTYRYIFVLEETAGQIRLAQISRLGYQGGVGTKLQHFGMLLSRTFILSQVESDKLYLGLVSRGYEDGEQDTATSSSPTEATSHAPLLQVKGVSFRYDDGYEALRQITCTIEQGERIALLGHNGAGKSTLFLLLSGLQSAWEGAVYLQGELVPPQERIALRKQVALVLQNSNYQLFTPSVEDEIAFGLKNIGLKEEALHARLEELLTRYELTALRHKPPHELSEGQKKWVALVAVLATDPKVLILDEPTAALDALYTERVLELLEELHQAGKTIIISTHDMELASRFADRVLLLDGGQLICDRKASELWSDTDLLKAKHLSQPWAWRTEKRHLPRSISPSSEQQVYHLPLFLSAEALPVLFVGGGKGIWRKAQGLIERQIPFTLMSPTLCPELAEAEARGAFRWIPRAYTSSSDIGQERIIILGIGSATQEHIFAEELAAGGYLFALLSDATRGNLQFGATAHHEGITLSVHSDYRLPEITQQLKKVWMQTLPEGFEVRLQRLAQYRQALQEATDEDERIQLQQAYNDLKELLLQDTTL